MSQDKKHKILFVSDHQISTSGVGTQSRWLIHGLLATNKYQFLCLGGAMKHENYEIVRVTPDWIIKPTDGFGDPNLIRQLLATERPDAIFLFTDPRFFIQYWEMEDEIHQICPIVYWHLWDNLPVPTFNKVLYESTDAINCINYPTYEFIHDWFPDRTKYVPHAVPDSIFRFKTKQERAVIRHELFGTIYDDATLFLFVGRNARRKQPGDLLIGFKLFLDQCKNNNESKKAMLVMHTDPFDVEGPNLHAIIDMLGIKDNIIFSNDKAEFSTIAKLYASTDCIVNVSSAEGFGLPVLEAKMCGTPTIAMMTGGLTRQVVCHETNFEFGVGLQPEVKVCVGTQTIPYIYDDYVSHHTIANAMMKMHKMSDVEREELSRQCAQHARKNYDVDTIVKQWDDTLEDTIKNWRSRHNRWAEVTI